MWLWLSIGQWLLQPRSHPGTWNLAWVRFRPTICTSHSVEPMTPREKVNWRTGWLKKPIKRLFYNKICHPRVNILEGSGTLWLAVTCSPRWTIKPSLFKKGLACLDLVGPSLHNEPSHSGFVGNRFPSTDQRCCALRRPMHSCVTMHDGAATAIQHGVHFLRHLQQRCLGGWRVRVQEHQLDLHEVRQVHHLTPCRFMVP